MSASLVYLLQDILRQHLPALSKPKSFVLAAFCLGMALAQRCKLRAIAEHLHPLGKPTTVERRLQRFLSQGKLPLPLVQLQLTRWVVRCCVTHRAVLLVDETCLGEHLRVMVVCLTYRQRAIPLAWQCYSPEQYPQGGRAPSRPKGHRWSVPLQPVPLTPAPGRGTPMQARPRTRKGTPGLSDVPLR